MPSDPAPTLRAAPDGRLLLVPAEGPAVPVVPRPCFPWSDPTGHLSLRDGEGNERAFLADASSLDPEGQAALARSLGELRRTLDIVAVHGVETQFQIRLFDVETTAGRRRFPIRHDDFPEILPDGSTAFRDLSGDLYRIPDPSALDPRSRQQVWAYLG